MAIKNLRMQEKETKSAGPELKPRLESEYFDKDIE